MSPAPGTVNPMAPFDFTKEPPRSGRAGRASEPDSEPTVGIRFPIIFYVCAWVATAYFVVAMVNIITAKTDRAISIMAR